MLKRLFHGLLSLMKELPEILFLPFNYLPGSFGYRIRYLYYKRKLACLGKGATIDVGVQFVNPQFIYVGENTWIDKYVTLLAGALHEGDRKIYRKPNPRFHRAEGEIWIGCDCHIASYVLVCGHGGVYIGDKMTIASGAKVYSLSHHYRNLSDRNDDFEYKFTSRAPAREQALIAGPVVIEEATAIGLNAVVLPGVTIGSGAWVGALAMVVRDVPAGAIVAGNPASVVKFKSKEYEELAASASASVADGG